MSDDAEPVLDVVAALRAAGVAVEPVVEGLNRWCIGDLLFSDAELVRIAMSRGLMDE